MGELWPQLLILVVLLAVFLFLILRLRPGRPAASYTLASSRRTRELAQRLDRSPMVVILLALIAILFLVVLVDGAYRFSRAWTTPVQVAPETAAVHTLMAQLASQLERYHRQHGRYPEQLELLSATDEVDILPALDPYRREPTPLDYRTDGATWWLLRSYGPDMEDGVAGEPFPLAQYRGQALDHPQIRRFLYDPSNGVGSPGDIVQVGGEARLPAP